MKEWLSRARRMDKRIKALRDSKACSYDRAISATVRPRETPGGGCSGSKSEAYALLSAEVDESIEELQQIRTEILHAIRNVRDSTLATLLIEYYINGRTWEQVAVSMNFSYSHVVHNLHPLALEEIKECTQLHNAS